MSDKEGPSPGQMPPHPLDREEVQRLWDGQQRYHQIRDRLQAQFKSKLDAIEELPSNVVAIVCDYLVAREEVEKAVLAELDPTEQLAYVSYVQAKARIDTFQSLALKFSDVLYVRRQNSRRSDD